MQDLRLLRSVIIRGIREYFHSHGFIETDTPSLVFSPGMEPHVRPLKIEGSQAYLPTSPEFAMKQLLAQGYEKIFQICKAYRCEPKSDTHNPEFSILEWYRGHSNFEEIMNDVEGLFEHLCKTVYGDNRFESAHSGPQNLNRPWIRLSIEECFATFAKTDLIQMLPSPKASTREREKFNDEFFLIFLNKIEPELKRLGRPVVVHSYPETQAALSNLSVDSRGLRWAKRFEVYAGGLELGNAFDELVDPVEQKHRFDLDMALRSEIYGSSFPVNPIDEDFLNALAKMPPSGGIAMGVDRIVMYFTGVSKISEILWLPSQSLNTSQK